MGLRESHDKDSPAANVYIYHQILKERRWEPNTYYFGLFIFNKVWGSDSITTLNPTVMPNLQSEITLITEQTLVSSFLKAKNFRYVYLNESTQATWEPQIIEQEEFSKME